MKTWVENWSSELPLFHDVRAFWYEQGANHVMQLTQTEIVAPSKWLALIRRFLGNIQSTAIEKMRLPGTTPRRRIPR